MLALNNLKNVFQEFEYVELTWGAYPHGLLPEKRVELLRSVEWSPELESDVLQAVKNPSPQDYERVALGMVIGKFYPTRIGEFDVPYAGAHSQGAFLTGSLTSDNVLFRAVKPTIHKADLSGFNACVLAENPFISESRFFPEHDALYESKNARVTRSIFGGQSVLKCSENAEIIESDFTIPALEGAERVTGIINLGKLYAPGSCVIAVRNLKDTVISTAHDINNSVIFAAEYSGSEFNKPFITLIKASDLEGLWDFGNMNYRLKALCEKYGKSMPGWFRDRFGKA
jgi:hypothetical protein